MKRLYNKLVNVEKDKLLHFIVMFILTLIIYRVVAKITHSKVSAIGISWFMAFAIGIAKEAYDEYIYKEGDVKDLKADFYGVLSAILVVVYNIIM